jgi:hypothetical protein
MVAFDMLLSKIIKEHRISTSGYGMWYIDPKEIISKNVRGIRVRYRHQGSREHGGREMDPKQFFKPISEWSVQEVRQLLKDKDPEDCNLVDVRQPKEFEAGHLPGGKLIPVGELEDRLNEIDPRKPPITY